MQLVKKHRVLVFDETRPLCNGLVTYLRKNARLEVSGTSDIGDLRSRVRDTDLLVMKLGGAAEVMNVVGMLRQLRTPPPVVLLTDGEGEFVSELVGRQLSDVVQCVFRRPYECRDLAETVASLVGEQVAAASASS